MKGSPPIGTFNITTIAISDLFINNLTFQNQTFFKHLLFLILNENQHLVLDKWAY